jgi:NADH:ubiquinone oxidoreductase subunit 4 (subunit M)
MNLPDDPQRNRTSRLSGDALVGLGITIGAFGFMFLLLAWAQHMRNVKAVVLLALAVVMIVSGAITAFSGSKRR